VESRRLAAQAVTTHAAWFEPLGVFAALQALAGRGARDPMDVVEDERQRGLLAQVLMAETKSPAESEVLSAIEELEERAIVAQLLNARARIAEAERRGDFAELTILTQKKLELDRALRAIQHRPRGGV